MSNHFRIIFITAFTSLMLISNKLISQDLAKQPDWPAYFKRIETADSLYKLHQYSLAAQSFSNTFAFNRQAFSAGHKYKAALAWALADNKDSAISNLEAEITIGYSNHKQMVEEPAFKKLKKDIRWNSLIVRVRENQKIADKKTGKYKKVKQQLEAIGIADQKYRTEYYEHLKNFSSDSVGLKVILKKLSKTDKANLDCVSKIIDKNGWLGYETIGFDANNTLFLVIQHSDSATQEKYLPFLKTAVKENKAFPNQLALLEDRIMIRRGEKQIYGSQVQCDEMGKNCKPLPIADEKYVDERRKSVGLEPLKDYLMRFGIEYKIAE